MLGVGSRLDPNDDELILLPRFIDLFGEFGRDLEPKNLAVTVDVDVQFAPDAGCHDLLNRLEPINFGAVDRDDEVAGLEPRRRRRAVGNDFIHAGFR